MQSPDLGPAGCWYAAFVLALFGLAAVVYLIVRGIIWVSHHVNIS